MLPIKWIYWTENKIVIIEPPTKNKRNADTDK